MYRIHHHRESNEAPPSGHQMVIGEYFVTMTRSTFNTLPEYSYSVPTGTWAGKVWRRFVCACDSQCKGGYWLLGEFFDIGSTTRIGINWRRIYVCTDAAFGAHLELARRVSCPALRSL